MMDYFVVDVTQYVFLTDADELAQPMTFYVEHPIDIDFHFNSIAYNKGLLVSQFELPLFCSESKLEFLKI